MRKDARSDCRMAVRPSAERSVSCSLEKVFNSATGEAGPNIGAASAAGTSRMERRDAGKIFIGDVLGGVSGGEYSGCHIFAYVFIQLAAFIGVIVDQTEALAYFTHCQTTLIELTH